MIAQMLALVPEIKKINNHYSVHYDNNDNN